ncbi:MAG: hypothetical protein ACFFCS_12185 [Candidatus Hodarchaeota archaeon]
MLQSESVQNEYGLAKLRSPTTCRICGKSFNVHVSKEMLDNAPCYPFMHVIMHGNPVHVHLLYIDKNGSIRGGESSCSIQIDRTSSTFQNVLELWARNVKHERDTRK